LHKPDESEDQAETRDTIQKIQSAANVGAAAVGRVREFARTEAGAYGPVNLQDVIRQAIAFTEPRWKDQAQAAGVMVDVRNQAEETPDVLGESAQLRELVALLVFNAVNAIPRRGSVSITTTQRDTDVVLTVRDDGLGMNKITKERCLDPNLGSRHEDGRSSGFGIIHGILQRHNAKLEIETEEGRGSRVSIVIPIATSDAQIPAAAILPPEPPAPKDDGKQKPTPAQFQPASPKGKRILVVEDDTMVREVMEVYLTEDGFDVSMATNGREGLEMFIAAGGAFDLLITDRAMPELNGDQVAIEAKRVNPNCPIILLTGFGELMLSEGERPQGVDLVVGKPFTMSSLHEALKKVGFA
jgi:CheY-like chemotaxis protein/anti-sigma regulatory factor (Ser/Thr protein kinase)